MTFAWLGLMRVSGKQSHSHASARIYPKGAKITSCKERKLIMIEKVNPCHPDKVADRIAGAVVDLAYAIDENPKVAVEVLIGHGVCHVIVETTAALNKADIIDAIHRIAGKLDTDVVIVPQDAHLTENQENGVRCGDNGIFTGMPLTGEQKELARIAREIYAEYPYDGKYIKDGNRLIICQSNAPAAELKERYAGSEVNPLGDWTGGTDVDTGATNRKLGSDMADMMADFPLFAVQIKFSFA